MSYKIITATEVICDSTSQAAGVIAPVLQQEVNKVWSFSFTFPPDHPYYDKIEERKTEIGLQLDNNYPVFWGTVYATKEDFYGQKTIEAEDMLGYLNDALMSPHRYNSQSVADILQLAVDVYNAQCTDKQIALGTVQTSHTAHNLGWSSNYESVLDMLQKNVIQKVGGFLRMQYRNGIRYLDYTEDYGSTKQTISIGANLMDFVKETDAAGLVSVLIPLGARLPDSEQDVEGVDKRLTIETDQRQTDRIDNNTLITAIGRKVKARIWDGVEDPDDLYDIGVAWLAAQVENVTIQAKAFDLNLSNAEVEEISLYDEVRIISDPHGLDARFPVMELTMNLNDPSANVLTLGKSDLPSLTQMSIEQGEKLELTPTWVDMQTQAAIRAAEVLEAATDGYIQFVWNPVTGILEQILIKDLTDPTNKWWRWNVAGLGYTKDGGTSYEVALTMFGELISNLGIIGGWEITASGLSKTVADPNDSNSRYRVTIYPPDSTTPGTSPVIEFSYSDDGGQSWAQSFVASGNGSIDAYGDTDSDARFKVIKRTNTNTYTAMAPISFSAVSYTSSTDYYVANYRANNLNIVHFLNSDQQSVTLSLLGLTFSEITGGAFTSTGGIKSNEWGVGHSQVTVSGNTWDVMAIGKFKICRLTIEKTTAVTHVWGSIYCGTPSQTAANFPMVELPYTFKSEPFCVAQLSADTNYDGWLVTNRTFSPQTAADKLKYTPAYDVARAGDAQSPTIAINYLVIGEVA